MSLNKQELVAHLAEASDVAKNQAEAVLNALVKKVHEVVASGGELQIADLGKFSVAGRAARTGRNPQTGDPVQIAAKNAPKFSPAKALKDAANQPKGKKSKK